MTELRDTPTPATVCPFCDHRLDAAMAGDPQHPDAAPKPGDLSVCISCASILVFNDDLTQRAPRPGEVEALFESDPKFRAAVRRAQRAVRQLGRRKMEMARPFRMPGMRLPDLLDGLSSRQRLRREREDAAFVLDRTRCAADPEAISRLGNTFAGTEIDVSKLVPYDPGIEPDFVICARLDLDHPLYFTDNRFASCADCGCDLQYRPDVPAGPDKLCLCCSARRVREAGDG